MWRKVTGMRFVLFVVDIPNNHATSEEMLEINQFNEKLQKDGNWVTAAGIVGSDQALLIGSRGKSNSIEKKSLVSGPENYTGFWIIEAGSEQDALELAKAASRACNRRVELRAYLR